MREYWGPTGLLLEALEGSGELGDEDECHRGSQDPFLRESLQPLGLGLLQPGVLRLRSLF